MRPGGTLCVRTTTTKAQRSKSRLDRDFIKTFVEVLNQYNVVELYMKVTNFIACRS